MVVVWLRQQGRRVAANDLAQQPFRCLRAVLANRRRQLAFVCTLSMVDVGALFRCGRRGTEDG